jgi:two-component system, NtrC family, sensor histidine kinase KinB
MLLRHKLSLGFGALLFITLVIGIQSILQLTTLGESIDVILRENYRSVIACQQMKEALEQIDKGVLLNLLRDTAQDEELIRKNQLAFQTALQVEQNTITLPGEGEKASQLQELFARYQAALRRIGYPAVGSSTRREIYFSDLLPLFQKIKSTADEILQMNQQNMSESNDMARSRAAGARRRMYVLLLSGTVLAIIFILLTGRWILRPIRRLIQSADEIRRGNLDLHFVSESRDEVGQLSEAFDAMAASLREFRRSDQVKLARVQRATQQAFDNLPDAVAVLDLEGKVEAATKSAKDLFGLTPSPVTSKSVVPWMRELHDQALQQRGPVQQNIIQSFVGGDKRYYRPEAIPIMDVQNEPTGVIVLLQDVTQLHEQEEIKRRVIATASHQLKTPLTSIRMAIHLLLDEKVGKLSDKQTELVTAAREDADRLHDILNDLLDTSRISSGRVPMDFHSVSPAALAAEAVEPFQRAAQEKNIALNVDIPFNLPKIEGDSTRLHHVFANLLSNALKYTPGGGRITLSAESDETSVHFSVSDTGQGIPEMYVARVFDPFFRVPDQTKETGAGLGLAIVKEIVEAHGGTIDVESRQGKGSTFTFALRRSDVIPKDGAA